MKTMIKIVALVMFVVLVGIVLSRTTIIITRYDDTYWQGDGTGHAIYNKTESMLIGGQIVKSETRNVSWYEGLGSFIRDNKEGIRAIRFGIR